ncbi:MAG: LD-carboxypeptidase [Rhodocyclaceae bacterium]|nr:LD-carboxypeptidase [Rhodocyclaceae bacterium]
MKKLTLPPRLRPGACIGVFTPSSPLYVGPFEEKFRHGVAMLERAGFRVKLGSLTSSGRSEGYRSGTARDRADEILELFADREVHGLISTVGGYNTSSLVDLLDFPLIQSNPKVVCGYSDVTSLHCALMTRAGLSTFYGPAVFPSFGEWPVPPQETLESFLDAVARPWMGPRCMGRPQRWSRHFRDATNGAWKREPRMWSEGEGWTVVRPGQVQGCFAPLA